MHSLLYRQERWHSKYELLSHTSAPWASCSAPDALQSSVAVWSPAVLQTTSSPMKHAVGRGSCFTGTQNTLCSQGKFLPDFTSREQEESELDCPQSCLQTVLRNNGWWFIWHCHQQSPGLPFNRPSQNKERGPSRQNHVFLAVDLQKGNLGLRVLVIKWLHMLARGQTVS